MTMKKSEKRERILAIADRLAEIYPEALCALTLNGAAAIGRADRIGSIEPGKQADLVVLNHPEYEFLVYNTAVNQVHEVYKKGVSVCHR